MVQITLTEVDLGIKKIKLPVSTIHGVGQGQKILVTAGLDGDEYASIDAAYQLIEEYSKIKFHGQLTIIPIVNLIGFENKTSFNPLDSKYPKNIFPGKANGSPTERLMHWLSRFALEADIWLDLHGGSLDEYLISFVYIPYPGNKDLRSITDHLVAGLDTEKIIYDKKNLWVYPQLEKRGKFRIIIESGFSALRRKEMVNFHRRLVKNIIGLLNKPKISNHQKNPKVHIFSGLFQKKANQTGLWFPKHLRNKKIVKGQTIGEIKSLTGQIKSVIKSDVNGELLWAKSGAFCEKGAVLVGLAIRENFSSHFS